MLLELLRLSPSSWGWISVTCRDGAHLRDGSSLRSVFEPADDIDNLAAVGINCTAPRDVAACIREIRQVTRKPIFVYPNSGERFDATRHRWAADDEPPVDWSREVVQWRALGAQGIGGCCRVGPADIRRMRQALIGPGV